MGMRNTLKITEEEARKLFRIWSNCGIPLNIFAKRKGFGYLELRRIFRRYFPDEYELQVELKRTRHLMYKRGRRFEYLTRDYLKQKGYFVLRSPLSRGIVDLVAIKKGEILLIQCKSTGQMSKPDQMKLINLAISIGGKPILASRGEYFARTNKIIFRELGGLV